MENKINIAEILKNCPKGTELYSPLCGRCVFDRLNMGTIICKKQNTQEITFTSEGYYMLPAFNDCECVLFPSKDQRDWSKFQRPFKDGDIVALGDKDCAQLFIFKEYIHHDYAKCYMMLDCDGVIDFEIEDHHVARLATEEEKQKLFDAIKSNGYKWNAETKTLKKLVESKFKVGDRIRSIISSSYYTIVDIKNDQYFIKADDAEKFPYQVPFSYEINYELVPNKFDISALKPFESEVLVRNVGAWEPAFWGYYSKEYAHPFVVAGGNTFTQCIPYKGNEHLLGTANDCNEFYKTWE